MPGDLREDLQASFNQLSEDDRGQIIPSPSPSPSPSDRDPQGRFSPRTPAQNQVPADKDAQGQTPAVGAPAASMPPAPPPRVLGPASWTPEEREEWGKLSPKAQAAVMRRERQMDEALRTSSQHREFATQVQNVLQPYSHMLQAENTDPVRAIGALMQTAAALRTAPPMQKAALVADLIIQHSVDPAMLDDHLSARYRGRGGPQDPMSPLLQMIDQRLQPVTQFINTFQTRQQSTAQQIEQEATTQLEQFMDDPQNEFARDVAEDMADLMELAAKRGQKLSLQEAYKRATMAHPTISEIVSRRALESSAAQQTSAAQRARQAAASVSDSGAPSQGDQAAQGGINMRSDIMSSIRDLSQRR